MKIIKLGDFSKKDVAKKAAEVLARGEILIYPTETVYGVGVDATNPVAVERLLKYKTMRGDKPFSIAVADVGMAEKYVVLNDVARNIYKKLLPGAVTVVSRSRGEVAGKVESPEKTVGVRISSCEIVSEIVRVFGKPMTATSANASGKKNPYKITDIGEKQQKMAGLILDAGELPRRRPSTIVDTTLEDVRVLRDGDVCFWSDFLEVCDENEMRDFVGDIFGEMKRFLGKKLVVFLLEGEMGVGKTFFVREFCGRMGVRRVKSPTFNLVNEYFSKDEIPDNFSTATGGLQNFWDDKKGVSLWRGLKIFHADVHRIFEEGELENLGFEDIFMGENVVFVEWSARFPRFFEKFLSDAVVVRIKIEHGADLMSRRVLWDKSC